MGEIHNYGQGRGAFRYYHRGPGVDREQESLHRQGHPGLRLWRDKQALREGIPGPEPQDLRREWALAEARGCLQDVARLRLCDDTAEWAQDALDRKSTRLNSSHANISYAVF